MFAAAHVASWTRWDSTDFMPVPMKRCGVIFVVFQWGEGRCAYGLHIYAIAEVVHSMVCCNLCVYFCTFDCVGVKWGRKNTRLWFSVYCDSSPWCIVDGRQSS